MKTQVQVKFTEWGDIAITAGALAAGWDIICIYRHGTSHILSEYYDEKYKSEHIEEDPLVYKPMSEDCKKFWQEYDKVMAQLSKNS